MVLFDDRKFALEAVDEGGLFGDFVAGLLDEMGRGFVDVIGVQHAGIKRIKLAANREDALDEGIMISFDDVGGDIEVELVVGEGKTEAAGLTFAANNGRKVGEFGDEKLIIVNEGIIVV